MKKQVVLLLAFLIVINLKGLSQTKSFIPIIPKKRFALIIGNKDYQYASSLKNPINDVEDINESLLHLGFEVQILKNADYREIKESLNSFTSKLDTSAIALVYFSGHGVSYGGKNYLLPIDAKINCLDHIDVYGVSLNLIISEISSKKVKNSFFFLDACRNLPNLKVCDDSKKDLQGHNGLVMPTNNPEGSMIVYATEEGSTADDNRNERNGMFTGSLLKHLEIPNIGIRTILDRTTHDVLLKTNKKQSPARYDKLLGDFIFISKVIDTVPPINPNTEKSSIIRDTIITSYKPHPLALKLSVASIGIISGIIANSIKSNFDSKVDQFNTLDRTLPVNGFFNSQSDLDKWTLAYSDAQKAQKTALLNATVATSILSLGYELFLLTTKVKVQTRKTILVPSISSTSLGFVFTHKF